MSPIYIRPAREQAEHDRLTVFLEAKYAKQYDVLINKGDARDYALKIGLGTFFPDVILQEAGKLAGVIEIETGESTNNLEALAQWVHFGKAKAPFHLYVPVLAYDAARRFCELNQVTVAEIWTYRGLMDGFDLVRVFHDPQAVAKSGKGPAAKVVEMPKPAEQPKPEPAPEPVEEILARISSREAAKAAAKAAAKPQKPVVVKTAVMPPKVVQSAPVSAEKGAQMGAQKGAQMGAQKGAEKGAQKGAQVSAPKGAPASAPKSAAKPAPKPAPKAAPKPVAKAAPKPAAKPAPKAVKKAAKAVKKPAPKAAPKRAPKPAPKKAPKSAPKAAKRAAKPKPKPVKKKR